MLRTHTVVLPMDFFHRLTCPCCFPCATIFGHAALARLLVFEPSISTRSAFCVCAASPFVFTKPRPRNLPGAPVCGGGLCCLHWRRIGRFQGGRGSGGRSGKHRKLVAQGMSLYSTSSSISGNAKRHKESCVETLKRTRFSGLSCAPTSASFSSQCEAVLTLLCSPTACSALCGVGFRWRAGLFALQGSIVSALPFH